jgi:hypothetical protein
MFRPRRPYRRPEPATHRRISTVLTLIRGAWRLGSCGTGGRASLRCSSIPPLQQADSRTGDRAEPCCGALADVARGHARFGLDFLCAFRQGLVRAGGCTPGDSTLSPCSRCNIKRAWRPCARAAHWAQIGQTPGPGRSNGLPQRQADGRRARRRHGRARSQRRPSSFFCKCVRRRSLPMLVAPLAIDPCTRQSVEGVDLDAESSERVQASPDVASASASNRRGRRDGRRPDELQCRRADLQRPDGRRRSQCRGDRRRSRPRDSGTVLCRRSDGAVQQS